MQGINKFFQELTKKHVYTLMIGQNFAFGFNEFLSKPLLHYTAETL
jgi:hypothetical protein